MNIAIAGYGFVGKAIEAYLHKTEHTTQIVDPKYSNMSVLDTKCDGIIICVDTPANEDGSCDMSNVIDVLNDTHTEKPVLIKSTISIQGWEQIKEIFPSHTISFSPEFIRADTAIEDMLNTKTIYIGGGHYYFWERALNRPDKVIKIKHADPRELILAKYFRNSFLATKVTFFNQIYDLCEATNIDFSKVSTLITEDSRIGQSHTEVTTERGFGGYCFPKDTQAIIETGHKEGVDLSLIREAIRYNNNIRKGDT